jgi:hypothetical protein
MKMRNDLELLYVFLVLILLFGLNNTILGKANDESTGKEKQKAVNKVSRRKGLEYGQVAPDFELPRLTIEKGEDGKFVGKVSEEKIKLSSFRGKRAVFLVFSSYT